MVFPKGLQAPLELPAAVGEALTTQGGNTLDNGTGGLNVKVNSGGGQNEALTLTDSATGEVTSLRTNATGFELLNSAFSEAILVISQAGLVSHPGGSQLNDASTISSGVGAPVIAGTVGDYFFRTDATGTANERVYVCTVTGAAGAATWVGIL